MCKLMLYATSLENAQFFPHLCINVTKLPQRKWLTQGVKKMSFLLIMGVTNVDECLEN